MEGHSRLLRGNSKAEVHLLLQGCCLVGIKARKERAMGATRRRIGIRLIGLDRMAVRRWQCSLRKARFRPWNLPLRERR